MSDPAVQVCDVRKTYQLGRVELRVLRGVSFGVQPGEFAAIVGASGSGKSTLLHLIGLLDKPDKGRILLNGQDTARLPETQQDALRRDRIGFVFQFYHLLPELDVLENALLPGQVGRENLPWLTWFSRRRQARQRAADLLDRVGLGDRLRHLPSELSGGERQRVAIARALMNEPELLLADEPTGNLDSATGEKILKVFRRFHEAGQTILMVTHDRAIAAQADRVLHLRDGVLAEKE